MKWTDNARALQTKAKSLSDWLGDNYVGTSHFVLAALECDESGVCGALRAGGIHPDTVRAALLRGLLDMHKFTPSMFAPPGACTYVYMEGARPTDDGSAMVMGNSRGYTGRLSGGAP